MLFRSGLLHVEEGELGEGDDDEEAAQVPAGRGHRQNFFGAGTVAGFGKEGTDEIGPERGDQVLADFDR